MSGAHHTGNRLKYAARALARSKSHFVAVYGEAAATRRAREIAALPTKVWKGQTLYTVTCLADFGKGPHQQNVPEYILWQLLDVRSYTCPFHR